MTIEKYRVSCKLVNLPHFYLSNRASSKAIPRHLPQLFLQMFHRVGRKGQEMGSSTIKGYYQIEWKPEYFHKIYWHICKSKSNFCRWLVENENNFEIVYFNLQYRHFCKRIFSLTKNLWSIELLKWTLYHLLNIKNCAEIFKNILNFDSEKKPRMIKTKHLRSICQEIFKKFWKKANELSDSSEESEGPHCNTQYSNFFKTNIWFFTIKIKRQAKITQFLFHW